MSELINALQDSLQQIEQGSDIAACLQQYPEFAEELRPLLESVARVRSLSSSDILTTSQITRMQERVLTQIKPASSRRWVFRNMLMSAAAALMLVVGLLVITMLMRDSDLTIEELPPSQDEFEIEVVITGRVEKLRFEAIVVEGVTIDPAGVFNPADLSLGDYVTVTGKLLSDDTIQATNFELVEDQGNMPESQNDSEENNSAIVCHAPPGNSRNARTLIVGESALAAHLAHGDTEGPCTGDETSIENNMPASDDACNTTQRHPVAASLALEFSYEVIVIQTWHCEGFRYDEIIRALLIQVKVGDGVENILSRRARGEGWDEIIEDYGLEPTDLDPGRIIGAREDN